MEQDSPSSHSDFNLHLSQLADDCQTKLISYSKDLGKGATQLENMLRAHSPDQLGPCIEFINDSKQKVLREVELFFQNFENRVRTQHAYLLTKEELEMKAQFIFQKISDRQQLINQLSADLNAKDRCLPAVKAIREPDFERESQKIQRDINDYDNLLKRNQLNMGRDEKILDNINQQLPKYIFIQDSVQRLNSLNSSILPDDKLSQREIEDEWDKVPVKEQADEQIGFSPSKYHRNTGGRAKSPISTGLRDDFDSPKRTVTPKKEYVERGRSPEGLDFNNNRERPYEGYKSSPNKNNLTIERLSMDTSPAKAPKVLTQNQLGKNTGNHYLHFFQDNSKKLHLLDLKKAEKEDAFIFETIDLNIDFKIPIWHRSIATEQGIIYLVGGADPEKEQKSLSDVYVYDPLHKTLKAKPYMNHARNSHGICILQDYIYVVGGCLTEGGYTTSCERLGVSPYTEKAMGHWENIASLNKAAHAPCVASFNQTHIYKFGGIQTLYQANNSIERYDPKEDKWTVIYFKLYGNKGAELDLMAYAACIQVNEDEIYVFGGSKFDHKSNQTYLFRPTSTDCTVHKLDQILPYYGTFWNTPVTYGGKLYALQNVQLTGSGSAFLSKRRILCYNDQDWDQIIPEEI